MSQLNGFNNCKASLNSQRDLVGELATEIRRLFSNLDRLGIPPAPSAPLAAPPQTSPPAVPLAAPPPASPPAQKPCTQPASPELPPQPTPSPVPAQSFPPSPSVEDEDEVEEKQVYNPLRNVKQMRQKFGAAKKMSRSRVSEFFETCVAWPAKIGGIDMRFSRDEEADAWYTTMLNAIDALPHWT